MVRDYCENNGREVPGWDDDVQSIYICDKDDDTCDPTPGPSPLPVLLWPPRAAISLLVRPFTVPEDSAAVRYFSEYAAYIMQAFE